MEISTPVATTPATARTVTAAPMTATTLTATCARFFTELADDTARPSYAKAKKMQT
jgi:hypothetical protein